MAAQERFRHSGPWRIVDGRWQRNVYAECGVCKRRNIAPPCGHESIIYGPRVRR